MKKMLTILILPFLLLGIANSTSAASFADIVFVIDQSGSMSDEFAWLGQSINSLNLSLAGINAQYGVAGYERTGRFGNQYAKNAFVELTNDTSSIINDVNDVAGIITGDKTTIYSNKPKCLPGMPGHSTSRPILIRNTKSSTLIGDNQFITKC